MLVLIYSIIGFGQYYFFVEGIKMGFLDTVAILAKSGFSALIWGFLMYFVILMVYRWWDLHGYWRAGLTVAAILVVVAPDAWALANADDHYRFFGVAPADTPAGLWLAIKAALVMGPVGHLVGFGVEKWALNEW